MNTINKKELQKFENMANDWWNPEGKFKPIHKFNPLRISFIVDTLKSHFNLKQKSSIPLKNLKILDLGCGGGLLSEPMARLGAEVTGLDASKNNIKIAKLHASKSKLKIHYLHGSIEKIKFQDTFDVILNMEVIEHVENVSLFVKCCRNNIKKNGLMFVATLNRTLTSYMFAIVGAEYILRWLPIGTHDWNKFITPKELNKIAIHNKFEAIKTSGVTFNPLKNQWSLNKDQNINYISVFLGD